MENITSYIWLTISIALLAAQYKRHRIINSLGIVYGIFILGLGVSNLATAGSINAILTFESVREPIAQAQFDALHARLDPTLFSGYAQLVAGAFLIGIGVVQSRKSAS